MVIGKGGMLAVAMAMTSLTMMAGTGIAGEFSARLDLSPEWRADNEHSPYLVPATASSAVRSLRQDLGVRMREGGFNAQGTLRLQAAEGSVPEYRGIVNQLYHDGEFGAGIGWTVGRKVMTWGVGHGFRPLDVVQREDRRGINQPPLVGVTLLALDFLDAEEATTLVWQHPGAGQRGVAADDEALAVRGYAFADETDLHAVARLSQRYGVEAGAGFSKVVGEEWGFHGAALYQRKSGQRLNHLAEQTVTVLAIADPTVTNHRRNVFKAVAGAQWTGTTGVGVLAEAWYDGEAWTREQWRQLDALTLRQRALTGVVPTVAIESNIAWSAQAFDRPNLMRENVMLRLTHEADQRWKSALEWLATPRDGGRAVTLSMTYEGNHYRLSSGVRWLGGATHSALAQSPLQRAVWLQWGLALP